jgi:hypothetical protein
MRFEVLRGAEMNNSRRIVELLTESSDLISALRRRKAEALWEQLHGGNRTQEKLCRAFDKGKALFGN